MAVIGAVVCVLAATLVSAEKAYAPSDQWNCGVLAPHWYCLHDVSRQYAETWATYNGTDRELKVTTKLIFTSGGRLWGEAYGKSDSGDSVKLISYRTGNYTKPLISNNDKYYHTILGTAIY